MKRLIISIIFCLLSSPAFAEVILTEQTEYYPVMGQTKNEIIKSMKRRSPYKKGNDYFPAYTQTDIKYEYAWANEGGRCAVYKVKVYLNLTYVYPKLVGSHASNVRWWWRDLMKKYIIHEELHGDISKRSAYNLDRELRSLKSIKCSTAKQTIASRAQYIVRQMKKNQKEYDRITEHGKYQNRYKSQ